MKYIAAVFIVASLVVGAVCSYFITSDKELKINLDVEFGVDHEPAKVIHYHITKEGVWGL